MSDKRLQKQRNEKQLKSKADVTLSDEKKKNYNNLLAPKNDNLLLLENFFFRKTCQADERFQMKQCIVSAMTRKCVSILAITAQKIRKPKRKKKASFLILHQCLYFLPNL